MNYGAFFVVANYKSSISVSANSVATRLVNLFIALLQLTAPLWLIDADASPLETTSMVAVSINLYDASRFALLLVFFSPVSLTSVVLVCALKSFVSIINR